LRKILRCAAHVTRRHTRFRKSAIRNPQSAIRNPLFARF
jgi:hypothetical protein